MINQVKLTIINHDGHQIEITKTPIEIEAYKGGSMLDDLYAHLQGEMKQYIEMQYKLARLEAELAKQKEEEIKFLMQLKDRY